MTVVRFTPEHVRALDRALMTMEAERAVAEKWRIVSPDLEDAIETLVELRDCMLAEQAQLAGVVMFPTTRRGEGVDFAALARLEKLTGSDAS